MRKWFGMAGGFDCTKGRKSCLIFHKLSVYEFIVRYLHLFCERTTVLEFLFVWLLSMFVWTSYEVQFTKDKSVLKWDSSSLSKSSDFDRCKMINSTFLIDLKMNVKESRGFPLKIWKALWFNYFNNSCENDVLRMCRQKHIPRGKKDEIC